MPPRGVQKGSKRERQYQHIKESERRQGASESRAEEIAARAPSTRSAPAAASRARAYGHR
jgi:hypothetical protein